MKVVISTVGRYHLFALARELAARGCLEKIFSGFPWRALAREGVPRHLVGTFPLFRPPQILMHKLGLHSVFPAIDNALHLASVEVCDLVVSRRLPDCDVFVGHEAVGLYSGREAKRRGSIYVCDRGCSHIGYRTELLEAEYDRVGLKFRRPEKHTFEKELAEYNEADAILVPSEFARSSFLAKGFSEQKIKKIPYGVSLSAFYKEELAPNPNFDLLFVGNDPVRKGLHYLFEAFRRCARSNTRLRIVGTNARQARALLKYSDDRIEFLGALSQVALRQMMSSSQLLVLPSVEEGLALVQAEALACGCPVIATKSTGAEDLFSNGVEGFIVPERDVEALAQAIDAMQSNPDLRHSMSAAALLRTRQMGGWHDYGQRATDWFSSLSKNRK